MLVPFNARFLVSILLPQLQAGMSSAFTCVYVMCSMPPAALVGFAQIKPRGSLTALAQLVGGSSAHELDSAGGLLPAGLP